MLVSLRGNIASRLLRELPRRYWPIGNGSNKLPLRLLSPTTSTTTTSSSSSVISTPSRGINTATTSTSTITRGIHTSTNVRAWARSKEFASLSTVSRRMVNTGTAENPTIPAGERKEGVKTRKRFAPLDPEKARLAGWEGVRKLEGVVFDVDGTLVKPQNWMFKSMRDALGIQKPTDILDHIRNLPPTASAAAMQTIKDIERTAMLEMIPQPGLLTLMEYLESRNIPKAICTRNFDAPVAHLLENHLKGLQFGPIITREFSPPKPHPAGILFIAKSWGKEAGEGGEGQEKRVEEEKEMLELVGGEGLIMVGDSVDDLKAGRAAGAATVLLRNPENEELAEHPCTDCVVDRLDDLIVILENGFEEIDRT